MLALKSYFHELFQLHCFNFNELCFLNTHTRKHTYGILWKVCTLEKTKVKPYMLIYWNFKNVKKKSKYFPLWHKCKGHHHILCRKLAAAGYYELLTLVFTQGATEACPALSCSVPMVRRNNLFIHQRRNQMPLFVTFYWL